MRTLPSAVRMGQAASDERERVQVDVALGGGTPRASSDRRLSRPSLHPLTLNHKIQVAKVNSEHSRSTAGGRQAVARQEATGDPPANRLDRAPGVLGEGRDVYEMTSGRGAIGHGETSGEMEVPMPVSRRNAGA